MRTANAVIHKMNAARGMDVGKINKKQAALCCLREISVELYIRRKVMGFDVIHKKWDAWVCAVFAGDQKTFNGAREIFEGKDFQHRICDGDGIREDGESVVEDGLNCHAGVIQCSIAVFGENG